MEMTWGHSYAMCVSGAARGWAWSVACAGHRLGDSPGVSTFHWGAGVLPSHSSAVSPHAQWPLSCRPHLSVLWGIPIPKCAGHHQHQRLVLEGHHVILIHAQDLGVRRRQTS